MDATQVNIFCSKEIYRCRSLLHLLIDQEESGIINPFILNGSRLSQSTSLSSPKYVTKLTQKKFVISYIYSCFSSAG